MAYQPFLIAPFSTGLDTDLSPWLLPQDAFSNIVNGHIHHGVIEKREGYSKQGDMVYGDSTNWVVSNVTLADPAVVTVTSTTNLSNGDTVEFRNVTGTTELNGKRYTVANLAGTTFELANVDSTNFTAYTALGDVYKIPGTRIMGLERYIDSNNVKEVIAFDQFRASKYNPTSEVYDPIDSSDTLNGGDTDFMWAANWASTSSSSSAPLFRLYYTNGLTLSAGLNGIRYYDGGSTSSSYNPQINAPAGPVINGCKLLFAFNQRLVLLHTIEGANTYPQRVRWCQAQGPDIVDAWDDAVAGKGGFVDAPTGDHIISAKFIQDILIVFFSNSIWSLRATSDPALPFKWDKINDFRACDGKMTPEQFDRYVISAGIRGIIATDGVESNRLDEKIESFINEEINDTEFDKTFSKRSFGSRRLWMLYSKVEDTDPNSALIYDEESSAFSKYDIEMNVLGYGGAAQDAALDDFGDKTLDEFSDDTLSDFFYDEGSEVFLGGNRDGEIFVLEQGGDDSEIILEDSILDITQANPAVVEITGDVGFSNGDLVKISEIAVGSMVELNDREFVIANKSGNSFELLDIDSSGFAAYVAGSGGDARGITSDSIDFSLDSAAWNPWMSEGKKSQMGYVDIFIDTDQSTELSVDFYVNNDNDPYKSTSINMLPDLFELGSVANVTNASPGVVTSNNHGISANEEVFLYNIGGMSDANGGPYTVTVVDKDNFSIGTDTTNFGIYTNCGVITKLPFNSEKAWKRVYAGGTGYQHLIKIRSSGKDKSLKINAFMPWFKARSTRPI